MNNKITSGHDFIEKILCEAAGYSGNMDSGKKEISASQLGNDTLQLFLKYKYGSKDVTKFEANTFGSIFHMGAELAFKDIPNVDTEHSMRHELSNGWTVTGSVDLILHDYELIVDHKTTTSTAIIKNQSETANGDYQLQLGVYRYLLWKTQNKLYNTSLSMVDKTYSYFKANKNDQLTFINVETHTVEDIEQLLLDKTNELQHYIDLDIAPDRCSNVFPYKRKGAATKPMRCIYYCDNNNNCPHYSSDYHDTNKLMDL